MSALLDGLAFGFGMGLFLAMPYITGSGQWE
ncbi:hypothetical protein G167_gp48 [Burkholderia phage BcepMigl]|uniref:Uncharacterized protein n=1 Tax=Burkholderia phage BcepMigl TaxID=2886899 RepID=I6XGD9_9CAUD|nr:hypothetical protein G167_gp48 [Burkholderia phage BcepMigl]AFN39106.1 hypothetical protein BcepMigl_gp37 [Burkholderia phage BcepMigl]